MRDTFYRRIGKRAFDLGIVCVLAPFWLPAMAVVAMLVWLRLGRPVFYCQDRPGLHEKLFTLIKFRTMTHATDAHGRLLPDEQRLTRFGKFLRSTSLDELPELWNVLLGHMSLVGPRPLLAEYLDLYTSEQARRHEVKPGLTGWAQVHGRNAIGWEEKFTLDLWYIEHLRVWLDLRILAKTVLHVFRPEGITEQGHCTARKFTGSQVANSKSESNVKTSADDTADREAVAIVGAGGHAKVVAATLLADGRRIEAFYDDDRSRWGTSNFAGIVIGPCTELEQRSQGLAILAIGDNATRRSLACRLQVRWTRAVHPNAMVHDTVDVAEGVLICAGAIVQPDVRIGAHSIINTGATVDHDTVVGKYVHVAPGVRLAGNVVLEDGVLMGIGSSAAPGVRIGKDTIVGAGAVVVDHLPPHSVAVGVPARVIKSRTPNGKVFRVA